MKPPVHVAVVGGSGSGKTWLAEKLAATLAPQAARLSLDDFYRDLSSLPTEDRDKVNFDDPAAIDWEKFQEIISAMRTGKAIAVPRYDFATHTRTREAQVFTPPPLVVWDGLWLLHHGWLRGQFTASVFVECEAEERFRRRAERDVRERGRTLESVRRQFVEHVEPMHEKFVKPQRKWAAQCLISPLSTATAENLANEFMKLCRVAETGKLTP